MKDLTPTAGARFSFEREAVEAGDDAARYRVAIHTPESVFGYRARLALGAAPEVAADEGGAGDALEAALTNIAKQLTRQAAKARDEGREPWPRRALRWKGPGRGTT